MLDLLSGNVTVSKALIKSTLTKYPVIYLDQREHLGQLDPKLRASLYK